VNPSLHLMVPARSLHYGLCLQKHNVLIVPPHPGSSCAPVFVLHAPLQIRQFTDISAAHYHAGMTPKQRMQARTWGDLLVNRLAARLPS